MGVAWILRQLRRRVVPTAVVRPRNILFVQRFAERAYIYRWDRSAFGNALRIHRAIRKESRRVIVDHVKVSRFAPRIGIVRERREVVADRRAARPRQMSSLRRVAV